MSYAGKHLTLLSQARRDRGAKIALQYHTYRLCRFDWDTHQLFSESPRRLSAQWRADAALSMQRGSRITKDGGALKSFLLGVSSSTPAQPFLYPIAMVLTPMQEAAHAAIRQRESVLLLSPTGSGKTLAYLLPLIERVEEKIDALQAVVVVPGRELAMQVERVLREQTGIVRAMALYGGRPTMEEHRRLRELRPHVVIATPGRLLDHIDKGNLELSGVRLLVIDEYDKCWEFGFRDEMARIAESLRRVPQVVIASATPFREENEEESGAPKLLINRDYHVIDFLHETTALQDRLRIYAVPSAEKDKLQTLARLLSQKGATQTIVFVAHRESADRVGQYLRSERFTAVVYHGGMEQDARERALFRFRSGAANVLVSTDLAARGLDIPEVGAVVHYHLPADEATFAHRSGRTARWQSVGEAYLIVGPEETTPDFVELSGNEEVNHVSVRPAAPLWAVLYIGRGKRDKLSKADIVGFLCKKGGLRSAQIGHIELAAHTAYVAVERKALAALLKQVAGEKIKGMKTIIEEMRQ